MGAVAQQLRDAVGVVSGGAEVIAEAVDGAVVGERLAGCSQVLGHRGEGSAGRRGAPAALLREHRTHPAIVLGAVPQRVADAGRRVHVPGPHHVGPLLTT